MCKASIDRYPKHAHSIILAFSAGTLLSEVHDVIFTIMEMLQLVRFAMFVEVSEAALAEGTTKKWQSGYENLLCILQTGKDLI